MTESRRYIKFFRDNLAVLLLLSVLGSVLGWSYKAHQPTQFVKTDLLEFREDSGSVSDRIALSDQAVTLGRSENIKNSLGADPKVKITIFKPAPFLISVAASSTTPEILDDNLNKEINFLMTKFPVDKVGLRSESKLEPNTFEGGVAGLALGLVVGILTSLIKTYFKFF
jgi:hypothetical protein